MMDSIDIAILHILLHLLTSLIRVNDNIKEFGFMEQLEHHQ